MVRVPLQNWPLITFLGSPSGRTTCDLSVVHYPSLLETQAATLEAPVIEDTILATLKFMKKNKDCLTTAGLCHVCTVEDLFTWTNKRLAAPIIFVSCISGGAMFCKNSGHNGSQSFTNSCANAT